MQNEILKPVLATDETAIPRYDIVKPDGSVAQQNVELRLKNEVMQQGTPYDEESVLPATLREKLGLSNSATPADAFEAVVAKAGAKLSMNEPTSQDNISAGYAIGAMWLRPYYTLTNMVYTLEASSITPSACTITKNGQTFVVDGNGDDKVISVSYTMPTSNGWLYAVVTPDSTASSATIVVGDKTVELTPGSASTVCVQFTGTALQVSATYSTANTASSGTVEIKNLTILDNAATVVQCVDSEQDITVASIKAHCDANAPYSAYNVPSKLFQQTHDGVWEVTYDSNSYTNQDIIADDTKALFGLGADAVPDDALAMLSRFPSGLCNDYVWIKKKLIIELGNLQEVEVSRQTSSSAQATISYADSVDENGLVNPSTLSVSYDTYTNANILAGKYWGGYYYTPEGNTATQHMPNKTFYMVFINAQKVTITTPIIGYVNSNDINAYPPEVDDGYLYTALGRIGDILGGQTT